MSKYEFFSGSYFPAFGLNAERYGVSLRIQSKCGKYGPEKTAHLDTFHAVHFTGFIRRELLICEFEEWNQVHFDELVNQSSTKLA